MALTYMATVYV